jgi:Zn ribbon nucleic-acid-binding protein
MQPGQAIRRLGFRRWYERQLFESFAWLATCLLSGVVFAAILEFVGFAGGGLSALLTLLVLYVVGLMGVTAWRTFWRSLTRAQALAGSATCPQCAAYGLFQVTADADPIAVRCERCGQQWRLQQAPATRDPSSGS